MKWKNLSGNLFLAGMIVFAGCTSDNDPHEIQGHSISVLAGQWITKLGPDQGLKPGFWDWEWTSDNTKLGRVVLNIAPLLPVGGGWSVAWIFQNDVLPSSLDTAITFVPRDSSIWHSFRWVNPAEKSLEIDLPGPSFPIPIARQSVQSEQYENLLELIQDLSLPFFNQLVTHWPSFPIPVRLVEAVNGPVDLAECLLEAMAIWNADASIPWFEANPNTDLGIRLVHFPDRIMSPSLAAKITRLDSLKRPLQVQILTGKNYDDLVDRPYAVRGLVHELGHALFLWGHSRDREHVLWRRGPPLVTAPSQDERKAALWWHGLPEGLDLSTYFVPNSPGGKKASWPQDGRP